MIRRAQKSDIPGILKLLVQVDMVHHEGRPDLFKGPATKYDEKQLLDIIEDPATPLFVSVSDDGTVEGHAFCMAKQVRDDNVLTDVKTLYIDDICVDGQRRRLGIGRALYEFVKSYARNEGFYNITLNVWECNPGAKDFYSSLGMQPQKVTMEEILM